MGNFILQDLLIWMLELIWGNFRMPLMALTVVSFVLVIALQIISEINLRRQIKEYNNRKEA